MDLEKQDTPLHTAVEQGNAPAIAWHRLRQTRRSRAIRLLGLACLAFVTYAQWRQISAQGFIPPGPDLTARGLSVSQLQKDMETCAGLHAKPTDPAGLGRERNARYLDGQKPTLIRNASVWIGEPNLGRSSNAGYSWVVADVLLEHGLIKQVGRDIKPHAAPSDVLVYHANGRALTSGIIDMHSHAGVHSLPTIRANDDTSELSTNITPYVRSVDGLQPTDPQIQVIKSGGVTTSLVLPGSGNNIGGEAFVIKHAVGKANGRNETSIVDLLADPDRTWRYMKMACGENPKHIHGRVGERGPTSRLGESWELRHAFEQASRLRREQDDWCRAAASGLDSVETYLPVEIKWEALVGVLRDQVHVHVHCYTIPDLEAFVDHSNEFEFRVRAFHHAHQAYLVPEVLKRAWGEPPALALFADTMWYKAEAYVGSEYAGKRLYDDELTPIYVSDNPILNAQHVVLEAAKAYRYGLPYHAALASVTSAPAERLGLGQRLGKVKPGFDADIVVWDSDPLSLGATPVQVWIDGVAQFESPVELNKTFGGMIVPDESLATVTENANIVMDGDVVFTGVVKVLIPAASIDGFAADGKTFNVAVSRGNITCVGRCDAELRTAVASSGGRGNASVVQLKSGYLTPSFTAFGSTLGLNEIDSEKATDNGADGDEFSRGLDGLALATEKLRVAQRYGVTQAISAPKFAGGATHHGTSAGFLTGATTSVAPGAVFKDDVVLHYTLDLSAKNPSMSAAIGTLRRKLLGAATALNLDRGHVSPGNSPHSEDAYLKRVVAGEMPLAITVHSADTIAAVLRVKSSVEETVAASQSTRKLIRLVIIGGAEAHLLARELASSGVGVVLAPMLSFAMSWDQRRALTGAPLTNGTAVDALIDAGVVTAIGLEEDWVVRDLGLLAGVAYQNSGGRLGEEEAMGLVGGNIYKMLGLEAPEGRQHFVIHEGSPLEIGCRVKAVGGGLGHVKVY